ncbi:hypothetical protein E6O75_ATG07863 [Venturia nashicola]|uniref:Uncharacterized protein n=1 Tax=Venturia nashicola TaxID=86259 RepID=A0A4Z1NIW2_9PEZI|nr:hypothetical protein E6O75_ATG07863 [Venturia nashicola]
MSALLNIFAPTSTSSPSDSQTLHNTATQPIPATPFEAEDTARVSSSSLGSSRSTSKSAQLLKTTPRKRGRPKKVISSPQPAPAKATRGRGRPKKILSSPQSAEAMTRSRATTTPAEIDEPHADEVAETPIEGEEDESDDDGNDGEVSKNILRLAVEEVKAATPTAKPPKGMPKGGGKNSKKTNATSTPNTRPTRDAAMKSAEKTSANYALSSDPMTDHAGVELAFEDAAAPKKAARGRKRASVGDEGDEVDGEEGAAPPPAKKRGRPPKNRVEQPVESTARHARLQNGFYEPVAVDADESPLAEEIMMPKRNRGRPPKNATAETSEAAAAGSSKGRGRARKKATTTNGNTPVDPATLRIRGFTFGMQGGVLEAQFDFVVGDDEDGYEIERTENGGFKMSFSGNLRV